MSLSTWFSRSVRDPVSGFSHLAGAFLGGGGLVFLLLRTEEKVFRELIPYLILMASLLLAMQGKVRAWLKRRAESAGHRSLPEPWVILPVFLAAIYGGYAMHPYAVFKVAMELAKGSVAPVGPKLQEALALIAHAIESVRRLTLDLGPAFLEFVAGTVLAQQASDDLLHLPLLFLLFLQARTDRRVGVIITSLAQIQRRLNERQHIVPLPLVEPGHFQLPADFAGQHIAMPLGTPPQRLGHRLQ